MSAHYFSPVLLIPASPHPQFLFGSRHLTWKGGPSTISVKVEMLSQCPSQAMAAVLIFLIFRIWRGRTRASPLDHLSVKCFPISLLCFCAKAAIEPPLDNECITPTSKMTFSLMSGLLENLQKGPKNSNDLKYNGSLALFSGGTLTFLETRPSRHAELEREGTSSPSGSLRAKTNRLS